MFKKPKSPRLKEFLLGEKFPMYETSEGWTAWRNKMTTTRPIRYWISNDLFRFIKKIVSSPVRLKNQIQSYLRNRFINKTHYLDTNLPRGHYYDIDERLIHGIFETLVDYVEIECAYMNVLFDSDKKKKYNHPVWSAKRWTKPWRSIEDGLDNLNWQRSLVNNPDTKVQGEIAEEIFILYTWWKERHARPDSLTASGWMDYCNLDVDQKITEKGREILDLNTKIDKEYYDTDTEMLCRLIKIRKHLWT